MAGEELISGPVLLTPAVCNPCELLGGAARSRSSSCHLTTCSKMTACLNLLFRRYKNQLQQRRSDGVDAGAYCEGSMLFPPLAFLFLSAVFEVMRCAAPPISLFPQWDLQRQGRCWVFFLRSQSKAFGVSICNYIAALNH